MKCRASWGKRSPNRCTKGRNALFRLVMLGVVVCSGAPARACSIPVFRYALVYWPADRYRVVVFHRGALLREDRAVVDRLQQADDARRCNIAVDVVDLDGQPDEPMRSLWEAQGAVQLPWMVVRYPVRSQGDRSVLSMALSERAVELLMDSPARRAIAGCIGRGDAAVWVLLESGDRAKDEAADKLLRAQVKEMEKTLRVPAALPGIGTEMESKADRVEPDRRVAFSIVRLSRSDPAEVVLVNALLDSEEDLRTFSEPMAFPIFGRGRVLYALVGRGISEANVAMVCAFLVDGCSCVVKAENPGVDLPMTADWEAALPDDAEAETGQGLSSGVALSNPDATADTGAASVVDDRSGRLLRNSLLGVAGGLGAVAAAAWILTARDRASRRTPKTDRA